MHTVSDQLCIIPVKQVTNISAIVNTSYYICTVFLNNNIHIRDINIQDHKQVGDILYIYKVHFASLQKLTIIVHNPSSSRVAPGDKAARRLDAGCQPKVLKAFH